MGRGGGMEGMEREGREGREEGGGREKGEGELTWIETQKIVQVSITFATKYQYSFLSASGGGGGGY